MQASPGKGFVAHRLGLVESKHVGEGTRVWAWAHVMAGARVGRDCNIGEHCFVEKGSVIGDEVVIKNGVAVWDGVTLENKVFIGPNAVFTNDLIPRSKVYKPVVKTVVRKGASIGANATLLCGIEVGEAALVAAGAVATRDVPPFVIVAGSPAKKIGYVCRCGKRLVVRRSHVGCTCGLRYRKVGKGLALSVKNLARRTRDIE